MKNSIKTVAAGTLAVVAMAGIASPALAHGKGGRGLGHSKSKPAAVTLTADQQAYVDAVKAARQTQKAAEKTALEARKTAATIARTSYYAALVAASSAVDPAADRAAARTTYLAALVTANAELALARDAAQVAFDTTEADAAAVYVAATGQDPSTIPSKFGERD